MLAYNVGTGGIILDPAIVRINCAYAGDGKSGNKHDDGCSCDPKCVKVDAATGKSCGRTGLDTCPEPDLATALRIGMNKQLKMHNGNRVGPEQHNEVPVNLRSVEDHLPGSILAFFYEKETQPGFPGAGWTWAGNGRWHRPKNHQSDEHTRGGSAPAIMREVHRDFLSAYPQVTAEDIPLLELDPQAGQRDRSSDFVKLPNWRQNQVNHPATAWDRTAEEMVAQAERPR